MIIHYIYFEHNHIKDKLIEDFCPRPRGKIKDYTKVVKNEFLELKDTLNIDDGKWRYHMFVKHTINQRISGPTLS